MKKPTAQQMACGHVEQTVIGSIIVEMSRVPSGHTYSVHVFRKGGEMMGSYLSTRLDVAYHWYRMAVEQVRHGKWY